MSANRRWSLPRWLGVLAVAAAVAAGCAKPVEQGPPTLKLATWFGAKEQGQLEAIVAGINQRHAGAFELELLTIPGDYQTKVDTMMSGNVAPDLFFVAPGGLASYADIGAIADLDARIRQDAAIDLADYYPAAIESSSWNGKLYALPWTMQPVLMYYNRDLFDHAGEPYPDNTWDWGRFLAAAKALTRKDAQGRDTWGFLQEGWPPLTMWVWQNGGDLLDVKKSASTLDDPRAVEALGFVETLLHEAKVSPGSTLVRQMGGSELPRTGRIAMFMDKAGVDLESVPGLRLGVTEVPRGRERATFAFISHLAISSRSGHQDEAYVAWRELLAAIHHWQPLPPRRSLVRRLEADFPQKAYAKDAILASMEYARAGHSIPAYATWEMLYWEKLSGPLMRNEASAAAIAGRAHDQMQRMLEMSR